MPLVARRAFLSSLLAAPAALLALPAARVPLHSSYDPSVWLEHSVDPIDDLLDLYVWADPGRQRLRRNVWRHYEVTVSLDPGEAVR